MLNGTIEINSKISEGASFIVTIPENQGATEGFSTDGNEFLFDKEDVF